MSPAAAPGRHPSGREIRSDLFILRKAFASLCSRQAVLFPIRPAERTKKTIMEPGFTHLDSDGNPSMVDVGGKPVTKRTAEAQALVELPEAVLEQLRVEGMQTRKGSILQTAILAGIMGAKRTGTLIPLCHPLGLDDCQVTVVPSGEGELTVRCRASTTGRTGVEMEALTGASVAALTIYDMCKALSHDIVIRDIRLLEKTGGKRDFKR